MLCCVGSSKGRPHISLPTDYEHRVHTEWNPETRQYKGLPAQWQSLINQGPRPKPIVEGPSLTDEETLRILAALPPVHPEDDDETDGSPANHLDPVILPGSAAPGRPNGDDRPFPASSHAQSSGGGPSGPASGQAPPVKQRTAPGRADADRDRRTSAVSHEEFRAALAKVVNSDSRRQHYDNFVRVGEGSTGVVCTAKDLINRRTVAIKKMDLRKQQRRELLFNEVRLLELNKLRKKINRNRKS